MRPFMMKCQPSRVGSHGFPALSYGMLFAEIVSPGCTATTLEAEASWVNDPIAKIAPTTVSAIPVLIVAFIARSSDLKYHEFLNSIS